MINAPSVFQYKMNFELTPQNGAYFRLGCFQANKICAQPLVALMPPGGDLDIMKVFTMIN